MRIEELKNGKMEKSDKSRRRGQQEAWRHASSTCLGQLQSACKSCATTYTYRSTGQGWLCGRIVTSSSASLDRRIIRMKQPDATCAMMS